MSACNCMGPLGNCRCMRAQKEYMYGGNMLGPWDTGFTQPITADIKYNSFVPNSYIDNLLSKIDELERKIREMERNKNI